MQCVSIVIPVYNTENEIQRTIDSLLHQTYPNIEIIVIDDGSTDQSAKIVHEMMQTHSQIKYYYQKNQGVSVARNYGIQKATGELLMFVDSDDYVSSDYVSKMVEALEDYDLVVCGVETPGKVNNNFPMVKEKTVVSSLEYLKDILTMNNCSYVIWNKLYRKALFNQTHIHFEENYRYEDMIFAYEIALNVHQVVYFLDKLYHYCTRENSYIATIPQNRGKQYIEAILKVKELLEKHEIIPLVSNEYYQFMLINHYLLSQLFIGTRQGLTLENYEQSAKVLMDLVREARNIKNETY